MRGDSLHNHHTTCCHRGKCRQRCWWYGCSSSRRPRCTIRTMSKGCKSSYYLRHIWDCILRITYVRLETRVVLGTNADEVAHFDAFLGLATNADGLANNLMAYADGLWRMSVTGICIAEKVGRTYGVGPQPLRKVCRSDPQMPEWVIWMSTSVSSNGLRLSGNSCHTILPSADSGPRPIHPANL